AGPIAIKSDRGVREITLNTLVGQISDGMDIVWPLPGARGWASIGEVLEEIYEAGMATPAARPAPPSAPAPSAAAAGPAAYDRDESVIAVMCGDTPPVKAERFPTLASEVMLRSGYFGLSTSFQEYP